MKRFLLALVIFLLSAAFYTAAVFFFQEKNISSEFFLEDKTGQPIETGQAVLTDRVVLEFTGAVDKKSVSENLKIEPKLKVEKKWQNNSKLEINIKEYPQPETEYVFSLEKYESRFGLENKNGSLLKFSGVSPPRIISFIPENGEDGVDYRQEMQLELASSLSREYFLKIEMTPLPEVIYSLDEEKKLLKIKPQKNLQPGIQYEIKIIASHREIDDYEKTIYQGSFTTKKPSPVVYNFDKYGKPLQTEERSLLAEPLIREGKYIDIDLTNQILYIFQEGEEKGVFKVSTGKRGMATPTGKFHVMGRSLRPWSKKYELFMPYFIQFTSQGHGIHELPEWPGGIKEGANHLGIPVSHGCIRLGVGPAKVVYEFAETDTPIMIHY